MNEIEIRQMQTSDYAEAVALWQSVEGVRYTLDATWGRDESRLYAFYFD